jgi:hypothetical protein
MDDRAAAHGCEATPFRRPPLVAIAIADASIRAGMAAGLALNMRVCEAMARA